MKLIRTLAVAAALASAPALAADLPARTAPRPVFTVAPFSWDGVYVGVNGGYATGKQTLNSVNGYSLSGYPDRDADLNGATLGGTVGYNKSFGNIVVGIEGDVNWANFGGTRTFPPNVYIKGDVDAYATLRARVGYAFDRFLPYVTGGLYYQHAKAGLDVNYGNGGLSTSAKDHAFGWTVGAGAEYALTQNWSVKGEYLYARVDDNTYSLTTPYGAINAKSESYNNIYRFGVNYRF